MSLSQHYHFLYMPAKPANKISSCCIFINMKKLICLLTILAGLVSISSAQIFLEPLLGYHMDMNNSSNRFSQFNTGLQFCLQISRRYELLMKAERAWPIVKRASDIAYSSNPNLPLSINAEKTIRPFSFSFSVGHRIKIFGGKTKNNFSALIYTGITKQQIEVSYQYDKTNYTIFSPDQTQETVSVAVAAGFEYMRQLKKGRLFAQLQIASMPLVRKIKTASSFNYIAPLSLNIGYSIPLSKI